MITHQMESPPTASPECQALWLVACPADSHAVRWFQEAFGCAPGSFPETETGGAAYKIQVKLNPDEARELSEVACAHMARAFPGEPYLRELALARGGAEVQAVLHRHPELPTHWHEEDPRRLREKARQVIASAFPGNALLKAIALAEGPLEVGATLARFPSVDAMAEELLRLRRESGRPLPGALTLQAASHLPGT
jgi:hypothetical protein